MDLIKLPPSIKDIIGRTYELALNPEKFPPFILRNHGLNKNNIEIIQNHFPNCMICQMFYNNYKKGIDSIQEKIIKCENDLQNCLHDNDSLENDDKSIHNKFFDDFDREEWNELSKKDREYFERTILKDLLDINDKMKSVEIAQAELVSMEECRKVNSLKIKYDKIEKEIKELIDTIIFEQFKKSYSCNIVYLNGSGFLNKFSMKFIRIINSLEKEHEEKIEKIENSIFIRILRTIEKILSGKKPLVKTILEHIENF